MSTTQRSRRVTRDMLVEDTFAALAHDELALTAVVGESVKMVRLAQLVRACKVARRAESRAAGHSHDSAPTSVRELHRALTHVLTAAEVYLGMTEEEETTDA